MKKDYPQPQRHRGTEKDTSNFNMFNSVSPCLCGNLKPSALKSIVFLFLCFLPFSAFAEIYKWTDDKGVVHVTDDPTKIPDKYWIERKVRKEEAKPAPLEIQPKQPAQPTPAKEEKPELYGDYPLDWWIYKFKGLRKDIEDNEKKLEERTNFVTTFEGGRRYGQIFTKDQVSLYERYKADIPVIEEKLRKLKEEIEELQRKATIYGIPREIRE